MNYKTFEDSTVILAFVVHGQILNVDFNAKKCKLYKANTTLLINGTQYARQNNAIRRTQA